MKVGIISDTHDNIWNMDKAFERMKELKVEALIHCGDFCAPFAVRKMEELGVPVHIVFGNTDDQFSTTNVCNKSDLITLYGAVGEFELGGKKIAITHFPVFAKGLAHIGDYDTVFHGHTHEKNKEIIGNTLLINPGELAGVNHDPSFAVYDTETDDVEFFNL